MVEGPGNHMMEPTFGTNAHPAGASKAIGLTFNFKRMKAGLIGLPI